MSPPSDHIESLFAQAITLAPAALADFLDEVGRDSPETRRLLESLLDADEQNHRSALLEWPSAEYGSARHELGNRSEATADAMRGRVVAGYRIVERIASGFSGIVYRAAPTEKSGRRQEAIPLDEGDRDAPGSRIGTSRPTETAQSSDVAIKLLRSWSQDEQSIARFRQEASALARLKHTSIAGLIATGTLDGVPFLVMPFVAGRTLSEELKDKPETTLDKRIQWFVEICEAVAVAHQNQIIHRDLKPSNVIITESNEAGFQQAVVTDFGIAKSLNPESTCRDLTQTGEFLGTPRFMAPEQIEGKDVNTLADIYGLGAILYFLLTDHAPFAEVAIPRVANAVLGSDPLPPGKLAARAARERDLEAICLKCLERQPDRRYQSVAELLAEIVRWRSKQPIHATKSTRARRVSLWAQANPRVALLSLALLTTVATSIVALACLWLASTEAERTAERERQRTEQTNADLLSILQNQIAWERQLRDNPHTVEARVGILTTVTDGFEALENRQALGDELLETSAIAWFNLARFEGGFREQGNAKAKQKALDQFRELARRFPEATRHRFALFHWHNLFGTPQEAFHIVSDLVAAEPDNPDFANCLATTCFHLGRGLFTECQFDEARDYLNRGIEVTDHLLETDVGDKRPLYQKSYIQLYLFRARVNLAQCRFEPAREDLNKAIEWSQRILPDFEFDLAIRRWYVMALRWGVAVAIADGDLQTAQEYGARSAEFLDHFRPVLNTNRHLWGACGSVLLDNWMLAALSGNEAEADRWFGELEAHFAAWRGHGEMLESRANLYAAALIARLGRISWNEVQTRIEEDCTETSDSSIADFLLAVSRRNVSQAQRILDARVAKMSLSRRQTQGTVIYRRLIEHLRGMPQDEWEPFRMTDDEAAFALAFSGYFLHFQLDSVNRFLSETTRQQRALKSAQ